jgi:hypothetical protein
MPADSKKSVEALRAKLRESEEEQRRLQMLIEEAEATPEEEIGGPDALTPRAEPQPVEASIPVASQTQITTVRPRQASSTQLATSHGKPRAGHAEERMKMDLDLDSPVLDDMQMQNYRESFALVEQLLQTAAQYVIGPSYEAMVEAEVIGACAVGPVSASDTVDVLCKASQIDRQHLFGAFKQLLEADPSASCARDHPEVVTGSRLSGIRFSYRKVQFKVFFARVPWEEDDDETFHSLNGCLLVRSLNEIIPNANSFGLALRMVKLWAQRRGIYGNACGYPGGVTWSICLARVCQMYPNANAAELVARFFAVYYRWDWRTVVALLPIPGAEPMQFDPVEEGKIAVMTPGGSPINTAAHVKKAALPILQEELRRAYKLSKMVDKGKACWSDLYASPSIANKNKHYIRLEFLAQSKEALELLVEWGEVCLPTLLTKFESELPNVQVRAWSQRIMVRHERYAFSCNMFIGLRFARPEPGVQQQVDLRIPVVNFLEMLDKWPCKEYFVGQYDTTLQHLRRSELQEWWQAAVSDGSLEGKFAEDMYFSDELADGESSRTSQLFASRWSDSIDEYTNMCVECH